METDLVIRLLVSAALLVGALVARHITHRAVRRAMQGAQEAKRRLVLRLVSTGLWVGVLLLLVITWGGSIENIWVTATGIVGIVAIGLFAVWSMLSNIVAGMILMLVKEYDIGDEIEITGDKVKGRIADITAFFVVIEQKRTTTLVPNNAFIQKIVKKR